MALRSAKGSPGRLLVRALALAGGLLAALAGPGRQPAAAGEVGRLFRWMAKPLEAVHREPPPRAPCDDPLDRLAEQLAWLDHHQRTYGWIVPKEPDVWGQTRLMRHRAEYEAEMARQLGQFSERTSAALRRSDQAFLGMALALQSASGDRRTSRQVPVPDATGSASVVNSIQGLIPSTNEPVDRAPPVVIARTEPFGFQPAPPGFQFDNDPVSLEPSVHLDQLSRYIQHLQALRRVNEGDDSADAPGYALALVRIPVSVTPGELTDTGHGAEITFTAELILGDELLPATFRSLVINDLVDVIAPPLTWCVNDPDCVAWAATIALDAGAAGDDGTGRMGIVPGGGGAGRQGVMAAMSLLSARLPVVSPGPAPAMKTRRARLPLPFSQLVEVSGTREIAILIHETHRALAGHPAGRPCAEITDVRGYLDEEAKAAAAFLEESSRRHLWGELPGWNLAGLVRGRRSAELDAIRCRFFSQIGSDPALAGPTLGLGPASPLGPDGPALPHGPQGPSELLGVDPRCCLPGPPRPPACSSITAVLAWGLLVESALLEERLIDDMRESASARAQGGGLIATAGPFLGPDPPPEARAAFNDYVRQRWPLRVFALDPVREEQNVDDSFSRRRETQIALAVAAASGRLSSQALTRYTRRLETDMATVALNQTAVGFAHGADTFGWRFYPRVQTPPTRGTLATLGETIRGGPTTDAERTRQRLEPGMRECTAILVLPSFVPHVRFDSTSRFFALVHPRDADPTMRKMLEYARAVQAMRHTQNEVIRRACQGADGQAALFLRQVDQLERRLPLQSLVAQVPHENTAGGFELFATGISDLAPELVGWFGSPGIDPAAATTLFLVGKGFSVLDTRVIAGGRPVPFRLLSRDLMEVTIPPGVMTLRPPGACCTAAAALPRSEVVMPAGGVEPLPGPAAAAGPFSACEPSCHDRECVDIHVATPYGVSGHLFVPVAARAAGAALGLPAFERACRFDLTFAVAKVTGSTVPQARVDEYYQSDCDAIAIGVPEAFIPPSKAVLSLVLRDAPTGQTAATFSFPDPFFDARGRRYLIAGGDLRNFVGDTSRPASDKTLRGAVKPWLDRLLQQGELAEQGESTTLAMSATIVAGQQEVRVEGELEVRVLRRGLTTTEPAEPLVPGLSRPEAPASE